MDWLRRQGNIERLNKLKQVIDDLNKKALKEDTHKEYSLYSDPTTIEANKREAMMTYLGVKGLMPTLQSSGSFH